MESMKTRFFRDPALPVANGVFNVQGDPDRTHSHEASCPSNSLVHEHVACVHNMPGSVIEKGFSYGLGALLDGLHLR